MSGVLEAVDLKSPGRFRLRDDVGNAIPLERVANINDARTLIGTRVTALGEASYAPAGQVLRLTDSTVPVSEDVVDAFVTLTVQCQSAGHALARKDHVADRWVAASAVALDRPLLALDRIYENAPGLTLLQ